MPNLDGLIWIAYFAVFFPVLAVGLFVGFVLLLCGVNGLAAITPVVIAIIVGVAICKRMT